MAVAAAKPFGMPLDHQNLLAEAVLRCAGYPTAADIDDRVDRGKRDSGRHRALDGSRVDDRPRTRIIGVVGCSQADAGALAQAASIRQRLRPPGAADLLGSRPTPAKGAAPYARSIAAAFDRYLAGVHIELSRAL